MQTMQTMDCSVAIIGAGPYGLAAVAHLRAAGVETRIFGEPMESWDRHMPHGMLLRSSPAASRIADPAGALTLERFRIERQVPFRKPVPVEDFVAYGRWFQQRAAPDLDRRRVALVERDGAAFRLRLEDGAELVAGRVVVATGILPFAFRPPQFDRLSDALVSHAFQHGDLARFKGRSVAVVGAGQSALECAALLHEGGAEVEVIARGREVFWLGSPNSGASGLAALVGGTRRLLRPLARPPFDIMGPRLVSWLLAWPRWYHRAPRALQHHLTAAATRPAGAGWLVPRLDGVRITTGRVVTAAAPCGERAHLCLDDGTSREVDHVLLATGYRVDVRRTPVLASGLLADIRTDNGYPDLAPGFESSVPGLHFVGTAAAQTFGPVCRFVVGSGIVARALTRGITAATAGGRVGRQVHAN